jgi:hypothetical protein
MPTWVPLNLLLDTKHILIIMILFSYLQQQFLFYKRLYPYREEQRNSYLLNNTSTKISVKRT